MTTPSLSAGHTGALVKVYRDPSSRIMARLPSWDYGRGKQAVSALVALLRVIKSELGAGPFVFELVQCVDMDHPVATAKAIVEACEEQPCIVRIDEEMRIIGVEAPDSNSSELDEADAALWSKSRVLAFYEDGSILRIYADRALAAVVSLDNPSGPVGRVGRYQRSADNYESSILDHYQLHVRYNQQTDHWSDRAGRRLRSRLGRATKTESIFHHSLLVWLEEHLDAASVKSGCKDSSTDELDIEVVSLGPRVYIVELKWLGRNDTTTSYSRARLKGAVRQLNTYLKKQRWTRGTAVVYDARPRDEFDAVCGGCDVDGCRRPQVCEGVEVAARGSIMVLFLESETASQS